MGSGYTYIIDECHTLAVFVLHFNSLPSMSFCLLCVCVYLHLDVTAHVVMFYAKAMCQYFIQPNLSPLPTFSYKGAEVNCKQIIEVFDCVYYVDVIKRLKILDLYQF